MLLKNRAVRRQMLAFCTAGVVGLSGVALAAPSKGTATVLNPFTLTSVPVSPVTGVVSAPVVVSAAPVASSGNAPGKGGMPASGLPSPPGPVIAPPLPPSAPVSP